MVHLKGGSSKIEHVTRYIYRRAVTLQAHRLLLTPRASHEVTPITSSVRCVPEFGLAWTQDIFGNLIATATFPEPTSELSIVTEALVDQRSAQWPTFTIDPGFVAESEQRPLDFPAVRQSDSE